MHRLEFTRLEPQHFSEIQAQPRQSTVFGMDGAISPDDAATLAAAPAAWSARREDGQLLACFGIVEQFPGRQGLCWALLGQGIGASHLQLTRFVRQVVQGCNLARLELLARAEDLEDLFAVRPELDTGQIAALAMEAATPEMRWAVTLGMRPAHLLRCYGAAGESYMLFERLVPRTVSVARDVLVGSFG